MASLGWLAELVGGELLGDAERGIDGVADLGSAGPRDVSFLTSPRYAPQLARTRAGAVLVRAAEAGAPCDQVVCADPYLAMARAAQALGAADAPPAGVAAGAHVDPAAVVDPTASVAAGAVVGAGATVGAGCVIGAGCFVGAGARLGEGTRMHPGARVLARCSLGARCILQAGAVVGSDGFGYAVDRATGRRHKIPQMGTCELGDDVELGANSTVDRATFGATVIGAGTKIDNLVQIAHNVVLGRDCVVVSQTGIAGSTRCGDRVVIGAQGGIVGHITIGDDVTLGARAGVAASLPEAGVYSGTPAQPHRTALRVMMAQQHVPELRRRLRAVEAQLALAGAPPSPAP